MTRVFKLCRRLWQGLAAWWPRRRPGLPVWGDQPPTILGICRDCGAVVLQGWEQRTGDGLRCRRCFSRQGSARLSSGAASPPPRPETPKE